MRNRIFTLIGLRSRSRLPSAIPLPLVTDASLSSFEKNLSSRISYLVSSQLSDATEKQKILRPDVLPSFPETEDQRRQREFFELNAKPESFELNAKPLTPPAFDLGAEFTHPDKAIMDVLSDFVEKNRGSSHYCYLLRNLLASARLRELGVGFNVIPIPDKQEWKASWHEEGKPNWLGTVITEADGMPRLSYTASVTGYMEKDGGKGGYGVVLFDHFGRPKVASVGVSLKGKVPLTYYEFQGVRSALQLAFDLGSGGEIKLYCNSIAVRNILDRCLELSCCTPACTGKIGRSTSHKLCTSCASILLYGDRVMEDFDLLFPLISDILDLFYKLNKFTSVNVRVCFGSDYLAKYFIMSTAKEYEMVMEPNEIPEEVVDSIYDEVFTGDRVHSRLIMVEEMSKVNEYTHPHSLFAKLRKFGTHDYLAKNLQEVVRTCSLRKPFTL